MFKNLVHCSRGLLLSDPFEKRDQPLGLNSNLAPSLSASWRRVIAGSSFFPLKARSNSSARFIDKPWLDCIEKCCKGSPENMLKGTGFRALAKVRAITSENRRQAEDMLSAILGPSVARFMRTSTTRTQDCLMPSATSLNGGALRL